MTRWVVAAVPLVVLGASVVRTPHITSVHDVAAAIPSLPAQPVELYSRGSTTFYYTSADLVHPEAFGPAGFIEAVLFDILPVGADASNTSLTWIGQFTRAMASGPASGAADAEVARRFESEIGGVARLPRGEVALFEIPPNSTYRRTSGIQALAALATRPAQGADQEPSAVTERGAPQLLDQAMGAAFDQLRSHGVVSVGVPRMIVRERIGDPGTRSESWETILRVADDASSRSGMRRVVFGGWGINPDARAATDLAFHTVWEQQRRVLAAEANTIADERLRVASLLAFAAIVQWLARRRKVQAGRLLALAMVATAVAVTIATGASWLGATLHLPPLGKFLLECAAALAAGAAIEQVAQFDPRKKVAENAAERTA